MSESLHIDRTSADQHHVLGVSTADELKDLTKEERIVAGNGHLAGNENDNGIGALDGGLNVGGLDFVADRSRGLQLADDGFGALKLLAFEGECRVGGLGCGVSECVSVCV